MKKSIFVFLILSFGLIQTNFAQEVLSASAASNYLLGPGDEIVTKVLGEEQFNFETAVDENGNIEVPFLETPINAMCKSSGQLKSEVVKALSKYLRNPQVSLTIKERKSRPPVTVTGEVRTPQQVTLMREARLLELISFSGGETDNAGGNVEIFRQRPPMCADSEIVAEWRKEAANSQGVPSRIYSLRSVKSGINEANPIVYPGDIVIVQKAAPVYIVGEVRNPQGVYLKGDGTTLTQAIAMVGGVTREAKTKDVRIYRKKANSIERETISVNLDLIKKGEQKDILLEANDQIEVDKTKKSVMQTILEVATGAARNSVTGFTGLLPQRVLY